LDLREEVDCSGGLREWEGGGSDESCVWERRRAGSVLGSSAADDAAGVRDAAASAAAAAAEVVCASAWRVHGRARGSSRATDGARHASRRWVIMCCNQLFKRYVACKG
jgi:hypothetical protein